MRRDEQSKAELRALIGADDSGTDQVSGTVSGTSRHHGGFSSPMPTSRETAKSTD
jgi:hypothetical protein